MTDQNNKLTLAERLAGGAQKQGITKSASGGIKINTVSGVPKLHQRLGEARNIREAFDPSTLPNRLVIMADLSSSMDEVDGGDKEKVELLKDALTGFFGAMNSMDTAAALEFFPYNNPVNLTTDTTMLQLFTMGLEASGSTPIAGAIENAIQYPLTRGIIISDGEADGGENRVLPAVTAFQKAQIPIDCVHIGSSERGAGLLQKVAKLTGGLYIKWTDTGNFAANFSYLTPQNRAKLFLTGAAGMLGAKEIK